jgi:hypothetical protein
MFTMAWAEVWRDRSVLREAGSGDPEGASRGVRFEELTRKYSPQPIAMAHFCLSQIALSIMLGLSIVTPADRVSALK